MTYTEEFESKVHSINILKVGMTIEWTSKERAMKREKFEDYNKGKKKQFEDYAEE